MRPDYTKLHDQLEREGTIQLELGEHPLEAAEWERLNELTSPPYVPYEHVLIGDAGEMNYVDVARFMTDVERPQVVNPQVSHQVLAILGQPKMAEFFRQVVGYDELVIRRCQVNLMSEGGFVGLHLDTDSNPDYISPVVLQFSSDYEGGDYVVHHHKLGTQAFRSRCYSMIISRCNLPHEVTKVTKGRRKSLVFFMSQHAGDNRRLDGHATGNGDGEYSQQSSMS
jgi:hypothetical protein